MGHTWQVALGAGFISAVLFFLLSIFRIREWIINSIPLPLRSAIAAGIGLFLALIALNNAGIVVKNPATMVGLGDLKQPARSEEHTSELQSLMRISYAVFCLKKQNKFLTRLLYSNT